MWVIVKMACSWSEFEKSSCMNGWRWVWMEEQLNERIDGDEKVKTEKKENIFMCIRRWWIIVSSFWESWAAAVCVRVTAVVHRISLRLRLNDFKSLYRILSVYWVHIGYEFRPVWTWIWNKTKWSWLTTGTVPISKDKSLDSNRKHTHTHICLSCCQVLGTLRNLS